MTTSQRDTLPGTLSTTVPVLMREYEHDLGLI